MKKESEYSIETLKRNETRRQRILDWLWAHGNGTFADLLAGINEQARNEGRTEYPMQVMRGTMATMLQKQEVAATGPRKALLFVPLVRTTEPAEAMRQRKLERNRTFMAKQQKEKVVATPPKSPCEPWRTRSRDLRDPFKDAPLPNQGGQGALQDKVSVNCAMAVC